MKRNELVRLTADIPLDIHKKLKAIAALNNKSMRDVLVDLITKHLNIKQLTTLLEK
jgi:hypothetical protein